MKITDVCRLALPEVQVIKFARFRDKRGYFTEHFRMRDMQQNPLTPFAEDFKVVQSNESFSYSGTVRGLHFQWNPMMGKLVRTISGHMIDLILDIRIGSPNIKRIIAYDMPARVDEDFDEWIWVPPGFAHGNLFPEDTRIEYFCTGEYNSQAESVISPLASDLDWTICDERLRATFKKIAFETDLITEKDKNGFLADEWLSQPEAKNFIY